MAVKLFGIMMINVQNIELSIVNLRTLKQVERVHSDVALGEDIYDQHTIDYDSVEQATKALSGFIQIMNDYGVTNYHLWGSWSLSTANNADYIQDQLFVRTGLKIDWLSSSQETYLRSAAVAVNFPKFKAISQNPTYLLGINSGSVGISHYDQGNFAFSRSLRLGPVRIAEVLEDLQSTVPNYVEVLDDYISSQIIDFGRFLPTRSQEPSNVVMLGVAPFSNLFQPAETESDIHELRPDDFKTLYNDAINASDQYLMDKYAVDEEDVKLIIPELLLINELLQLTNAKTIWLGNVTALDGLIVQEAVKRGYKKYNFNDQIVTAAKNLANRYNVEPKHRDLVTKFALHLFDQLKPLHHLTKRDRLLLQVATIVHDVGSYIDPHEHYMHSDYILRATELTGLTNEEKQTIATIARYHSAQTPSKDIKHFEHMSLKQRLVISKLSAILRIADALDDGRQQKIRKISVSIKNPKIIITCFANDDLFLENWVFSQKAKFFKEVFGLTPVIKRRGVR
ncbi:Ppx/GppA phosphatase family protein [Lactiplantibacillus mudanjiangensis]|uniref:Exopolyphosphatase [Lactobacillus sp.] n=1 Tax=Lactiplantibacillus mudanjiangensis TaxID=1296538 RepID=A0A660DWY5_9LACO|nr:HD domain-containing protein [Lactiplantibacillus mudanjiangensis]VDG17855.1 exopolyphosphatase [Lactobacillus sp.] [Lactiplantibacillus mudanjiangensis]VDG23301.1 exopolyphosphatase [Lactobacillus sp.] [Lactiplantibacillus mudanjiangensis]VDG28261.1 exopolyphosphatase [Lactobacillus sp.] [Lactiplantibacillus mudanjiangensis]VDG32447.1 exopolyphosphatase [Lactobacillus sp.] [Lactiplantibacillus mudanjiangensis]